MWLPGTSVTMAWASDLSGRARNRPFVSVSSWIHWYSSHGPSGRTSADAGVAVKPTDVDGSGEAPRAAGAPAVAATRSAAARMAWVRFIWGLLG